MGLFKGEKITFNPSYPRIWDKWARGSDDAECCELVADNYEHDILTNQNTIHFKTLDPKFINPYSTGGKSRFANEINLMLHNDTKLLAEVTPQGRKEIAGVFSGSNFPDWYISRKGLVYLSRHSEWKVNLTLPEAEAIFTRWLESKGWKEIKLSSPGRIAKQMIHQLGGIVGIEILAREGIIPLLRKISSSNIILSRLHQKISQLQNQLKHEELQIAKGEVEEFVKYLKEIRPQLSGDEKSMSEEFVWGEIQKIANQMEYKIKDLADKILRQLIEARILQLGLEVQCPICTQHSWYSMKAADYELQCPECLAQFSLPSGSKAIKWAYRTLGPFSSANQDHGAYTVLLTLRFFSSLLEGATTPLMSFTAKKDGMKLLEADLALFFRALKFGSSKTEVIFVECKTFNPFQKKDVDRMIDLGKSFPDAILVFAKLKEKMSNKEKAILCSLADRSRKNRMNNRPFNPVLILTGTDLYWKSQLSYWWKERGRMSTVINPRKGMLELCDLTQQINLGMDSWDQWYNEQSGIERYPRRVTRTTWTPSRSGQND